MSPSTRNGRDRLAAAALDLFFLHGYAGTSIRAITQSASVSKSLFHYHFESKEALLEHLVDPYLTEGKSVVDQDEAAAILQAYCSMLTRYHKLVRIITSDLTIRQNPKVRDATAVLNERLRGRLCDLADVNEVMASAALGAISRPLQQLDVAGQASSQDHCEQLVAAALAVLKSVQAGV